jgi:Secretion system C-terminal sorting domain/Bacterial Ig domain
MNVHSITHLLATTRHALMWVLVTASCCQLAAQGAYKPIVAIANASVRDTISGVNLLTYQASPSPKHGMVSLQVIQSGGGSNPYIHEVKYTPAPGFLGLDTFVIELNYNGNFPFLLYKAYAVSVLPSILKVQNDFAVTPAGTNVTVNVLQNDFSSAGNLQLTELPYVESGSAVISGNQIVFSPASGFDGIAHFSYTTCDAAGHCKTGSVNISVFSSQPSQYDTLNITTVKNTKLDHVLAFDGYALYLAPDTGSVVLQNGFSFSYSPKLGYFGTETFTLVNQAFGTPKYLHVIASVINTPSQNTMAMDDYAYTAKGKPVTFSVRTNDVGNLNVTGWTPPAANQGAISATSGLGMVTFTPAPNFKGVATFKYRIGSLYNNNVETATAHVVVGDMNPTQSTYNLSTPMETPLVINYQLPFIGFDFNIVQSPVHGVPSFFPGTSTFTSGAQNVTGNNLLVFTPDAGYSGPDEMIINYCISGTTNCYTVKIVLNVTEIISTAAPYCLEDCVWSGDVNHDGIVNNKDILPLGYFMGENGEDRPNASLEWYGQYADNWNNPYLALPFDLKHADSDGDGVITLSDTSAVHTLYGNTHNLIPSVIPTGKGLPFEYHLLTPNPQVGDLVQVEVQLGKATDPALNVFGFTFDVSLSNNIVDSAFAMNFYNNTWLNNNAPSLAFSISPRPGRLESAFTRIGNTSVSGMNDRIGRYDFIIVEIIDDVKGDVVPYLSMQIDGGQVLHNDGSYGYIEPTIIDVPVRKTKQRSNEELAQVTDAQLFAYPSPVQEELNIHLNGDHLILDVQVINPTGQVMSRTGALNVERTTVNTAALPDGVYFLRAFTTGGPLTKKFVKKA